MFMCSYFLPTAFVSASFVVVIVSQICTYMEVDLLCFCFSFFFVGVRGFACSRCFRSDGMFVGVSRVSSCVSRDRDCRLVIKRRAAPTGCTLMCFHTRIRPSIEARARLDLCCGCGWVGVCV